MTGKAKRNNLRVMREWKPLKTGTMEKALRKMEKRVAEREKARAEWDPYTARNLLLRAQLRIPPQR